MKTKPAKILVLDDELPIAELLGELLTIIGHQPVLCVNPIRALEVIGEEHFDLILSDFRMPEMNGEQFYSAVRDRKPALAERIIFLTGDVVNEETQAFFETLGNPHLAKPFLLANIEDAIAQVLG